MIHSSHAIAGRRLTANTTMIHAVGADRRICPQRLAILDAVTPLLRRINTLPAYSRTTRQISPRAQAIRQAILNARAPDELLFEELPMACDLLPFAPDTTLDDQQIETFFSELGAGLQELQDAYAKLIEQVQARIRGAFGVSAAEHDALHAELTERYQQIAAATSDSQVRAFGVRLEHAVPGNAWVESVAALVGRKPLDTWHDADLASFELQIADLGRRFKVIEQVAVTSQALFPIRAIVNRVVMFGSITRLTQRLDIVNRSPSSPADWHNMISR